MSSFFKLSHLWSPFKKVVRFWFLTTVLNLGAKCYLFTVKHVCLVNSLGPLNFRKADISLPCPALPCAPLLTSPLTDWLDAQLMLSPCRPSHITTSLLVCPGLCSSWGGTTLGFRTPTAVALPPSTRRCRGSSHITCSRGLRQAWMSSHKVWPQSQSRTYIFPLENVTNEQLCLLAPCSGWGVWGGGHSGAEEDPDHGEQVPAAAAGGGWGEAAARHDARCTHALMQAFIYFPPSFRPQRFSPSSEMVMIDRTFNQEERSNLTQDKRMVLVDPGKERERGVRGVRECTKVFCWYMEGYLRDLTIWFDSRGHGSIQNRFSVQMILDSTADKVHSVLIIRQIMASKQNTVFINNNNNKFERSIYGFKWCKQKPLLLQNWRPKVQHFFMLRLYKKW